MSHLSDLQAQMKAGGVEAVLISSELNQRYLTGFTYTDGYVVVFPDTAYLLADFRYIEAARATADASEIRVVMPDGSMLRYVASLLEERHVKGLCYEEETVSCALRIRLGQIFEGVELLTGASKLLEKLRMIKDAQEIAWMKQAQKITDDAFTHILDFITPERTELEVALELEFFMRARGSEGVAFETIAVSGSNSSRPHGVPRPVKLEKGFLTMDFGARYNGYCSDMTRTVVIGKADDDMKKLYHTVLDAQLSALNALHVGMKCSDADKVARDIIDGAGYKGCFGHSLGHGVGLFIHENPRFAATAAPESLLEVGHVVTVEPGIYIEGKYGCRIEDMVTALPDGTIYDFTQSPKELIEL